jgi:glycosyltransferase involved in cell wall biosynthesis
MTSRGLYAFAPLGETSAGPLIIVVGDRGVLCDVADHITLARGMTSLLDSPELRIDLDRSEQRNELNRFDEDAIAGTTNRIYEQLVGECRETS